MKKIDVLMGAIFLIMISLTPLTALCEDDDDAKVTPTPTATAEPTPTATAEPTPTACCPDGSSLVSVYWDAKAKKWAGEMTDVTLSSGGMDVTNSGRCIAWEGPGMEVIVYAGGGEDTDYCWDTETGKPVRTLHPEVTFSWIGLGYVDENDDRIFHMLIAGPDTYLASVSANDGGDCNAGPEAKFASCDIIVYRVQGVFGPSEITRAEIATYSIQVDGLNPYKIKWHSSDHQLINDSTQWQGKIVKDTVVSCIVIFKCPFTQNEIPSQCPDMIVTLCNDREWNITVGSCEESNEDDIDNPAYLCGDQKVGEHRDKETNIPFAFYPNFYDPITREIALNPERQMELILRGVGIEQITDNGPNHGFWHVASSSFVVDQEFVINKWLRSDAPPPPDSDINWYNKNLQGCDNLFGWDEQLQTGVGVAAWLQAHKDHENEGNHTASNGAGSGHHAQMRREENYFLDLRSCVEDDYSRVVDEVKSRIFDAFMNSERCVNGDPGHVWVEENWKPIISDLTGVMSSVYNPDTKEWTGCYCISTDNF
ncbi:hypothetical protein JW926_01425 [Candidatus Sumerlaeota bacterium]|nr:hypothetical protein [Candidatus Sumerlaeota bacterium]